LVNGSRRRLPPGVPVVISNDHSQLVFADTTQINLYLMPLTLEQNPQISFLGSVGFGETQTQFTTLRWDSAGLRSIQWNYSGGWDLFVKNWLTTQSLLIWHSGELANFLPSWSPDGNLIALWSWRFTRGSSLMQYTLHVISTTSQNERPIALLRTGSVTIGRAAISPDNSRIVYAADTRLYLKTLR
jgi:hypothetical protein